MPAASASSPTFRAGRPIARCSKRCRPSLASDTAGPSRRTARRATAPACSRSSPGSSLRHTSKDSASEPSIRRTSRWRWCSSTTAARTARGGSAPWRKKSAVTVGFASSAGAKCPSIPPCWAPGLTRPGRISSRPCSCAAPTFQPPTSMSAGSTSPGASWLVARRVKHSRPTTWCPCRHARSSTRDWSSAPSWGTSIRISATRVSRRRWPCSISATAPTPTRPGSWLSPSACWRITARSTRWMGTATGWPRGRQS